MRLFYAILLVLIVFVSACAQQPEPAPVPTQQPVVVEPAEEVVVVEEEEVEVAVPSTSEVRILAGSAFDPDSLTINVGDSVTWINSDEKVAILIIFKDDRAFQNSNRILPGEKFEQEFTEAGSYQYWRNIAFTSDGATITVE